MKRLFILCEGPTEEGFVNTILGPHLYYSNILAIPIICATKQTSIGKFKGGICSYGKIKNELTKLCKSDTTAIITTMFDYYGLPDDTPGISIKTAIGDIYAKAKHIEREIETDIGGLRNLFFNLTLHEFEGFLFTDTAAFSNIADRDIVIKLQQIKESFDTPEHINDSPITAPSKLVKKLIPTFSKPVNGVLIAQQIGLNTISSQCKHFNEWLSKIQTIANRKD